MKLSHITRRLALASAVALSAWIPQAQAYTDGYLAPAQGWKLLQSDFDAGSWLDPISLEWDYWMIHSDTWNGIVAYLLANPRHKSPSLDWALLPPGQNVAVVGEVPGQKPVANYVNFGYDGLSLSPDTRAMKVASADGNFADYSWTRLASGEPAARLKGRSPDWEWDFTITQDLKERDRLRALTGAFLSSYGRDMDALQGSEWNVDEMWPRTQVEGSVTDRKTGKVIPVKGKGYREDGWGKYAIPLDGWDFMVFGETDPKGAIGSFQTYHQSESMDWLDISFYDGDQMVATRFHANASELGWIHPQWKWDTESRACVPTSTRIVGKNKSYSIELSVDIGSHQRSLLTNLTVGSSVMFIAEHFPTVTGVIRRADGTEVRRFVTRGGGEFAKAKDVLAWRSDFSCTLTGQFVNTHTFPR